jgi:putative oxidoreductase
MIGTTHLERKGNGAARDLALLPPRAALGATMLYHGLEKLRSVRETAQSFESLGIRPAQTWARATGLAETAAGVLSVLGVLTRPAALAVLVTQGVAIAKVHARQGFPATKGGYEFNLALMTIAAALLIAGPGRFSTHEALGRGVTRKRRRRLGLLARLLMLVK